MTDNNNTSLEKESQRSEKRVSVVLPIRTISENYVTRDISPSGIYFEANDSFKVGNMLDFIVDFADRGSGYLLKCSGEVIRVDERNGIPGVAVKFLQSNFEYT
jgi:hypothetical protein